MVYTDLYKPWQYNKRVGQLSYRTFCIVTPGTPHESIGSKAGFPSTRCLMIALHEHEEIEREWLSAEPQDDGAIFSALDDHEARHPTVAYADDFVSTLVSDDPP